MTWYSPPGAYGSADPLFLLLIALAVEAYVGDRRVLGRWGQAPRRGLAALLRALEQRLDRPERSRRARLLRGWTAMLFVLLLAVVAGLALTLFRRHYPFGWVVELLLLVTLLAQRSTWVRGQAVLQALESGSLELARAALPPLTARTYATLDLARLDRRGILLAALGGIAGRAAGGLVAPTFWYVAFGLPGLFLQQALHIAAAGHAATAAPADEEAGAYGRAAVACNRVVAYLPDRLAGLIIIAAALFVPQSQPRLALANLRRSRFWAQAALGGALGLRLNRVEEIGTALLRRALFLFAVVCLINAGLVAGIALLRLAL
ncbi:MAG: cobalamin biosynthesis protein [Kiloniellales bacterium]